MDRPEHTEAGGPAMGGAAKGSLRRCYRPEWVDDQRGARRWVEVHTTLARFGEDECLGKTADISEGGMRVALQHGRPRAGEALRLTVVFEQGLVDFRGCIVYCEQKPWGSLLGVRVNEDDAAARGFLARHCSTAVGGPGPATA